MKRVASLKASLFNLLHVTQKAATCESKMQKSSLLMTQNQNEHDCFELRCKQNM